MRSTRYEKNKKGGKKMKKRSLAVTGIIAVLFMTTMAYGGKISLEYGKELFNDAKLGGSTNESSCNSCHAGGKGLENANIKKFSKAVNKCIIGHMEGSKIDGRKAEMRSLKKYIQSL
jgi:cytochrome c peroxidase